MLFEISLILVRILWMSYLKFEEAGARSSVIMPNKFAVVYMSIMSQRITKSKEKCRGIIETQNSGNTTSSGEIGLNMFCCVYFTPDGFSEEGRIVILKCNNISKIEQKSISWKFRPFNIPRTLKAFYAKCWIIQAFLWCLTFCVTLFLQSSLILKMLFQCYRLFQQ